MTAAGVPVQKGALRQARARCVGTVAGGTGPRSGAVPARRQTSRSADCPTVASKPNRIAPRCTTPLEVGLKSRFASNLRAIGCWLAGVVLIAVGGLALLGKLPIAADQVNAVATLCAAGSSTFIAIALLPRGATGRVRPRDQVVADIRLWELPIETRAASHGVSVEALFASRTPLFRATSGIDEVREIARWLLDQNYPTIIVKRQAAGSVEQIDSWWNHILSASPYRRLPRGQGSMRVVIVVAEAGSCPRQPPLPIFDWHTADGEHAVLNCSVPAAGEAAEDTLGGVPSQSVILAAKSWTEHIWATMCGLVVRWVTFSILFGGVLWALGRLLIIFVPQLSDQHDLPRSLAGFPSVFYLLVSVMIPLGSGLVSRHWPRRLEEGAYGGLIAAGLTCSAIAAIFEYSYTVIVCALLLPLVAGVVGMTLRNFRLESAAPVLASVAVLGTVTVLSLGSTMAATIVGAAYVFARTQFAQRLGVSALLGSVSIVLLVVGWNFVPFRVDDYSTSRSSQVYAGLVIAATLNSLIIAFLCLDGRLPPPRGTVMQGVRLVPSALLTLATVWGILSAEGSGTAMVFVVGLTASLYAVIRQVAPQRDPFEDIEVGTTLVAIAVASSLETSSALVFLLIAALLSSALAAVRPRASDPVWANWASVTGVLTALCVVLVAVAIGAGARTVTSYWPLISVDALREVTEALAFAAIGGLAMSVLLAFNVGLKNANAQDRSKARASRFTLAASWAVLLVLCDLSSDQGAKLAYFGDLSEARLLLIKTAALLCIAWPLFARFPLARLDVGTVLIGLGLVYSQGMTSIPMLIALAAIGGPSVIFSREIRPLGLRDLRQAFVLVSGSGLFWYGNRLDLMDFVIGASFAMLPAILVASLHSVEAEGDPNVVVVKRCNSTLAWVRWLAIFFTLFGAGLFALFYTFVDPSDVKEMSIDGQTFVALVILGTFLLITLGIPAWYLADPILAAASRRPPWRVALFSGIELRPAKRRSASSRRWPNSPSSSDNTTWSEILSTRGPWLRSR